MSKRLQGSKVMRQSGADTLITEEPNWSRPDLWGGWPVMAVSTRNNNYPLGEQVTVVHGCIIFLILFA